MANIGTTTDYPVHLGFWTNWSQGRFAGATVTLSHRNGALLTAFLAIFVTTAGTNFWRIICFAVHQLFSSEVAEDGLYHQRQAVLRNAANETSGINALFRLCWAWRGRADKSLKRMLPLLCLALVIVSIFAVAGILSSRLGQMGDEVLISSPSCGELDLLAPSWMNGTKTETIFFPFTARRAAYFAQYAQSCYSDLSGRIGNCGPFVKSHISSKITRNADCPFHQSICRRNNRNIRLESSLNTISDLGLNTPLKYQSTIRVITSCGPLITAGHKETYNFSASEVYTRYFYGQNSVNRSDPINYTYQYEQRSWDKLKYEIGSTADADYSLSTLFAHAFNNSLSESSNFIPIDALFQGDGDVVLIFLSANNVQYFEEVNDDWYSAHQRPPFQNLFHEYTSNGSLKAMNIYMSDEPASALGCKLQYQVCDPGESSPGRCSRLGGAYDLGPPDLMTPTEAQQKNQAILWVVNSAQTLDGIIGEMGGRALTSHFGLNKGAQGPLPDDQWQVEVENWHNTSLAALQGNMLDQAVGPEDTGILENFWRGPKSDIEEYFCKNQKIRSTAYSNFSVLWLSIILIIGSLIIVLNYVLVSMVMWIERRRKIERYSRIEWLSNDLLQLQRLAHEEIGFGTWSDCAGPKAIPVTEKDEKLAVIDMRDSSHPKLDASRGSAEKLSNSANETVNGSQIEPSTDQSSSLAQPETSEGSESTHIEDTTYGDPPETISASHLNTQEHSQDTVAVSEGKLPSSFEQSTEAEARVSDPEANDAEFQAHSSSIQAGLTGVAVADSEKGLPRF